VEALGLLLAVDPIPNGFRTVANVTGMMAVAVLAGGEPACVPTARGAEGAAGRGRESASGRAAETAPPSAETSEPAAQDAR
jgi:hypothetical protein